MTILIGDCLTVLPTLARESIELNPEYAAIAETRLASV